jgi:hypothetical protein
MSQHLIPAMKRDRLAIRELVEAYARWILFRGGVTRRITLELMKLKPARRKRTNCDSWDQRHVTTASA